MKSKRPRNRERVHFTLQTSDIVRMGQLYKGISARHEHKVGALLALDLGFYRSSRFPLSKGRLGMKANISVRMARQLQCNDAPGHRNALLNP